MSFLLVGAIVEERAKAGNAHEARGTGPARIESRGWGFQLPETPANLKLVGVVIVKEFKGVLDGLPRLGPALSRP